MKTLPVRLIAVCMLAVASQGCALLGDPLERAAKGGGDLVKFYCKNVTIPEVRQKIRERVNAHAAPYSIAVDCGDDTPVLKSDPPAK